jgi:hypothetical protein
VKQIRVYGFRNSADLIEFDQVSDSGARLRVRAGGPQGPVAFERFVSARDTREVQLHIDRTGDVIRGNDDLPFKVSIAEPETPKPDD